MPGDGLFLIIFLVLCSECAFATESTNFFHLTIENCNSSPHFYGELSRIYLVITNKSTVALRYVPIYESKVNGLSINITSDGVPLKDRKPIQDFIVYRMGPSEKDVKTLLPKESIKVYTLVETLNGRIPPGSYQVSACFDQTGPESDRLSLTKGVACSAPIDFKVVGWRASQSEDRDLSGCSVVKASLIETEGGQLLAVWGDSKLTDWEYLIPVASGVHLKDVKWSVDCDQFELELPANPTLPKRKVIFQHFCNEIITTPIE